MQAEINGQPSFAYLCVELAPGESIVAEPDAMASMDSGLTMQTHFNGGFFSGLAKKFLGGETLFINKFSNLTREKSRITLVQTTPGDVRQITLKNEAFYLQPGAYLCSTPGLQLGVGWAGLASGFGREGFFRLKVSGSGTLWYGGYGALVEKEVDGDYIVDTGHLVAYEPQMQLHMQLAGGLFSSFFGGEGLVTRVEGRGKIILQTRSLGGLRDYLNPKI